MPGVLQLEAISAQELLERAAHGEVTVLDIRPQEEYASGHLPNAINLPPDEVAMRIAELESNLDSILDKKKTIVAYCRGPYCLYSHDAVKLLREKGFMAQRLQDGFPEWQAAGYPVEHPLQQNAILEKI